MKEFGTFDTEMRKAEAHLTEALGLLSDNPVEGLAYPVLETAVKLIRESRIHVLLENGFDVRGDRG